VSHHRPRSLSEAKHLVPADAALIVCPSFLISSREAEIARPLFLFSRRGGQIRIGGGGAGMPPRPAAFDRV
jgi:hypothetical protein